MSSLRYIVTHVFFPPKRPYEDDYSCENEHALCDEVRRSAQKYKELLPVESTEKWSTVISMLKNLTMSQETTGFSAAELKKAMDKMDTGSVLALLIRAQNAGIIIRKSESKVTFESFEVSPSAAAVMSAGKLLCSYPGPAISVDVSPHFNNESFRQELCSFLSQMNTDVLDSVATTTKAGSEVQEQRDTAHPRYITALLTGILRGIGEPHTDVVRIRKRIADDVVWNDCRLPWRRSSAWLVIRVALQTTLWNSDGKGNAQYKHFMAFLMHGILQRARSEGYDSDLLFCMRAKLARRIYKLGESTPHFILDMVEEESKAVQQLLEERWKIIRDAQAKSPPWSIQRLNNEAKQDTTLSLRNSRVYISQVLLQNHPKLELPAFRPNHSSRPLKDMQHFRYSPDTLKELKEAFRADPFVALFDFERSVQDNLDRWVSAHISDPDASVGLHICLTEYLLHARKLYKSNPEDQSVMILTVFELWVALDKIAVKCHPLLKEYSPEVPLDLLQPVLLRKTIQLDRLVQIQKHLYKRHSDAFMGTVFSDSAGASNFAVRFFDTCPRLQQLLHKVEEEANTQRSNKRREYNELRNKYQEKMDKVSRMKCEYYYDWWGRRRHSSSCPRCELQTEAEALCIEVHEWPLPQNPNEAKVAVFEIACPLAFNFWRGATYVLLNDLCYSGDSAGDPDRSTSNTITLLEQYAPLRRWMDPSVYTYIHVPLQLVSLASSTKSFLRSHYSSKQIEHISNEDQFLVNSGLTWKLFDESSRSWATEGFRCSIAELCTFQLPTNSPYRCLQFAISGVSHTSNFVQARQSNSPNELSLHEFISFASLRSGENLQWINIARELACRTLTFHRDEVHLLFIQAAWQIGAVSMPGGEVEWHRSLFSVNFAHVLIREARKLLCSVESNWMEMASVHTLIALCSRLLASATDTGVKQSIYDLLKYIRRVLSGWIDNIGEKLEICNDESLVQDYEHQLCEVAAICRATYDVDEVHLSALLQSSDDLMHFFKSSMIVYDNTPPTALTDSKLRPSLRRLLQRDRRLSLHLESALWHRVQSDPSGLNRAISSIWQNYKEGASWERVPPPNDRWIYKTRPVGDESAQTIHMNLLTGCLLIDGKPLGRLPRSMTSHPTYNRVLSSKLLKAGPSDILGMEYASQSPVFGYTLHFVMREKELIIRAKNESEDLELIPHERMNGDFPELLVTEHVHWLNHKTREIEFRPLKALWQKDPQNWCLAGLYHDSPWSPKMHKNGSTHLIDIISMTSATISSHLEPLEDNQYLTVCLNEENVFVELPRFGVSFFVNPDYELECSNMPGMIVDRDSRAVGSLFGLSSQLILRSITRERPRIVLIPQGEIRYKRKGDHVSVTVDTSSKRYIRYYEYVVQDELGYLEGSGSLEGHLYKILLHAVTSHCLPDPLTRRTGTQEALAELSSARTYSFQSLSTQSIKLLKKIGSLTPQFEFYPSHLKVMHTVHWQDLPCVSQHYDFYHLVNEILECNSRLRVFHGSGPAKDGPIHNDRELLKRYTLRHQSFYPPTDLSTRSISAAINDVAPYSARDNDIEKEPLVYGVSASVYNAHVWTWETVDILETLKRANPSISGTVPNIMQTLERWRKPIPLSDPETSLSYSQAWLDSSFFSSNWLTLYELCRSTEVQQCYKLLFSLSSLSYKASENDLLLVPIVIQFFRLSDFHNIHPPKPDSRCGAYDLSRGYEPRSETISYMLSRYIVSIDQSCSANLERRYEEGDWDYGQRRVRHYEDEKRKALSELTEKVMGLWRTARRPYSLRVTSITRSHMFRRFELEELEKRITEYLDSCFWNLQLKKHIEQVQTVLIDSQAQSRHSPIDVIPYMFQPNLSDPIRSPPGPSLLSLIKERRSPCEVTAATSNLQSLVTHMQKNSSNVARLFCTRLSHSRNALAQTRTSPIYNNPASKPEIDQYEQSCREQVKILFGRICTALKPQNYSETILYLSGLWPLVTRREILGKLSFPSRFDLPEQWRKDLVDYGQALVEYQRSVRLLQFHLKRDYDGFSKERNNNRPLGLNDEDWILVQLSGNFLARDIQITVANEMMTPSCSENSVIQLNMGEGKSSVIVPLIASSLAHGGQLVRIVVLKSLSVQMFQLLVDRLSGLANRRIYYLPFSRDIKLGIDQACLIQTLYEECMEKGGILLTQPEHILSFRLMGLDRLLSSEDSALSSCLIKSQCWLEKHARDVFDESDELLHVKYQLVYTLGLQRPLEGHPNRWTTVQEVFSLVLEHASELCKNHPKGLELTYSSSRYGTFPIIRILQDDVSVELVGLLSKDVLEGRLKRTNLPFERFTPDTREDAKAFITEISVESSLVERLSRNCSETTWSGLLLLRGLLAHGVLVYVLQQRRWRVDYGLDAKRTLLAVPYRAKDVPSLRAEFGHPDVAIALTCLSYYYGGLVSEQLNTCFELLFNLDNPAVEYEQWVSVAEHVPESLKTLSGINLNDVEQHQKVTIPLFFRNRAVIDFFLTQVVFPKFAKEFPHKLSTSGWDLAEEKTNFITGFSGTNDNQDLLPVYISQKDLVGQESTNALVLSYILQPENAYRSIERPEKDGNPPSTTEFLELLVSLTPEVKVLLDVGAQMLELTNRELAREWLTRCNDNVSAAVYFNDLDQLMVISRDNTVESFQSSHLKHQPERCVFYLDDAHTRGIDLKLPKTFRAAVTLGEKVTKDRLVQGCMRMRKLGHGQSVIFLAPMEIEKKIRDINGVAEKAVLKPEHVIQWAYSVTFAEIEHYVPHWLKQGVDHSLRKKAWESYKASGSTEGLQNAWMQREARTLEEMYGVEKHKRQDLSAVIGSDELAILQKRCRTLVAEDAVLQVNMDEEQEREVSNEQEQERQIERPPEAKSAQHHVHQDVRNLVKTGQVPADSADSGIVRLFSILETSAPLGDGTAWQIPNLLCSVDFATVIKNQNPEVNSYMRPLNWILSGAKLPDGSDTLVVISPFEANELMPTIRASTKTRLHVYAPKVTQSMRFFDDLKFLTIPEPPLPDSDSWSTPDRNSKIIMQLNLFAGQLYLADLEAYRRLCLFLGILPSSAESHIEHESDGFVPPAHRRQLMASECPFRRSPLPVLGELFSLRRKGNTYAPTHLGKIIGGRSLVEKDFMPQDFSESESYAA